MALGTTIRRTAAAALALALALALACTVSVAPAYAKKHLEAPINVSDDITRLHVSKLDADTHEYVRGAVMAIIEKDTGVVVDEWVTGEATHENEKGLDVEKVYVLRELEAPEGYGKVEDVEFKVNETEGTGITVLSQGADSELVESYKVNLYDRALPVENEVVVTKTRAASSSTSTRPAPKTGDEAPLLPVAVAVLVGIVAIGLLQIPKRHLRD